MPGGSPFDQLVQSYLSTLLANNTDLSTILRQMSFGLINVVPPAGEPSLTSQLNNIVFQIQSLRDHLDTANTTMISQNVDILAAIAALPDGTSPVVLPSPPAGYGGPSTSAIAADVWSYTLHNGGGAGDELADVYGSAQSLGGNSFVSLPGYPWMVASSNDNWADLADQALGPPAVLDSRTILPTDASILAWANRAHPGPAGWTNVSFFGHLTPRQVDDNTARVRWWITMTPAEFAAFQTVAAAVVAAPVWPGLAAVTLSTPVSIATALTITDPMDGVIVSLAGVPTRSNFFQFDDKPSYRNLGALAFFDDNGEMEAPQNLGFEQQVMTPRSMKQAAGVKLRTEGGVSGTLTPWTITP